MNGTLTCIGATGARETVNLADWLSSDLREQTREDAYAFIKRLRHVPFDGGLTMRSRFTYRDDSLWWFTELYLHKMRRIDTAIAAILACEAACRQLAPAELAVTTDDPTIGAAVRAFGSRQRMPTSMTLSGSVRARPKWTSFLVGATAHLSRLRPTRDLPPPPPGKARVLAFVHTAFWRGPAASGAGGQEQYIGAVLGALSKHTGSEALACVGVGPRRHFRARRWCDPLTTTGPAVMPIEQLAPRSSLKQALAFWRHRGDYARDIVTGDAIRSAAEYRGCDLWSVLQPELTEVARIQWPWSVRAMDEAAAALDALSPGVIVTYAEAGGWGRALMLEARRRGMPSVGLQHGFIYRHWLNYRHEPDEMTGEGKDRGFPRPDSTLLFDGYAARQLESAGSFPPDALLVTGSPRLDELAAHVRAARPDRTGIRREAGIDDGGKLVVVAAKFSEIQGELDPLFNATAARPDLMVVVKPHPADQAQDYERVAAGRERIRVAAPDADLGRLLAAADAVVTMNSTVALDAMVLGVPSLVVGLPNNLSPFVAAGVMVGGDRKALSASLETLLYDRDASQAWRHRAEAYAAAHDMRADGHAATRAADAILRMSR